jgi:hypothetical protein
MSYLKDLDEYTTKELETELAKRRDAADKGLCDYCFRPRSEPACRLPERHAGTADGLWSISINGRQAYTRSTHLSYDQLVAMAGMSGQPSMTGFFPSTGHGCIVSPGEYVRVREGMRIDVCHTGAA